MGFKWEQRKTTDLIRPSHKQASAPLLFRRTQAAASLPQVSRPGPSWSVHRGPILVLHAEGPQSHQGQDCGQAELGAHPAGSSVTSSIPWGPARAGTWLCSQLPEPARTQDPAPGLENLGRGIRTALEAASPAERPLVPAVGDAPVPSASAGSAPWERGVQVDPNFTCGSEPAGKSPCGLKSFQPFNQPQNSSKPSQTSPEEVRRVGGQKSPQHPPSPWPITRRQMAAQLTGEPGPCKAGAAGSTFL